MISSPTREIKNYMLANSVDHIDNTTGSVNSTALAEDTTDHFDLYENEVDYAIPEWVYELALDYEEIHI